ncbi:hypothetical protein N180_11050 [Pedobacter antarcticus 4BY]|uniref:Uncharacterized protein n=2 Tax=Pedobacter antarcticus TaxID=34086 RepID=A0A081PLG2_9SPHI|nr:hypothetical protein [Pedobacter antarcticus]KEQ31535.1 hypothetical protein N180_11050 [Pedobacter antarcticus 4BY]SFF25587.1 hypothetical protein SAMN03003324_03035 [Pedobacter antarcticus]
MSIDFSVAKCQDSSRKRLFGICDDPAPATNRAYLDEENGAKWIVVVQNEYEYDVLFTAIDHCIQVPPRPDNGRPSKRCDGMLSYNETVIFVELKERAQFGTDWIRDAEKQLKTTIAHFETTELVEDFKDKKAYAANSEHPKSKQGHLVRIEKFFEDTGYVLRLQNRITVE